MHVSEGGQVSVCVCVIFTTAHIHGSSHLCTKVEEDAGDDFEGDEDEQIQNAIAKTMRDEKDQIQNLKEFINTVLPLPVSMHASFCEVRRSIATRALDLSKRNLTKQLEYIYTKLEKIDALSASNLTFASQVSNQLKTTSNFAHGTEDVFATDAVLGRFCALRPRYMLLILQDMQSMGVLKHACPEFLQSMVAASSDFSSAAAPAGLQLMSEDFMATLAGFDAALAEPWLQVTSGSLCCWKVA